MKKEETFKCAQENLEPKINCTEIKYIRDNKENENSVSREYRAIP